MVLYPGIIFSLPSFIPRDTVTVVTTVITVSTAKMGLSLKQLSLATFASNFDISNIQMFDLVTRWSIEIWDSRMRIGLRCPVKSHKCRYSCFARELLSCEMTKLTRTNGPTWQIRASSQGPTSQTNIGLHSEEAKIALLQQLFLFVPTKSSDFPYLVCPICPQ